MEQGMQHGYLCNGQYKCEKLANILLYNFQQSHSKAENHHHNIVPSAEVEEQLRHTDYVQEHCY